MPTKLTCALTVAALGALCAACQPEPGVSIRDDDTVYELTHPTHPEANTNVGSIGFKPNSKQSVTSIGRKMTGGKYLLQIACVGTGNTTFTWVAHSDNDSGRLELDCQGDPAQTEHTIDLTAYSRGLRFELDPVATVREIAITVSKHPDPSGEN